MMCLQAIGLWVVFVYRFCKRENVRKLCITDVGQQFGFPRNIYIELEIEEGTAAAFVSG